METTTPNSPQSQVVILALGALGQILAASRALWQAIEVADDNQVLAPSAAYLHESHAGLVGVLRGPNGNDGLLNLVDGSMVLGWPEDAAPMKVLGGGYTLYQRPGDGAVLYGSPAMVSAGHSLWFSSVNMALGLVATMAREEASSESAE